MFILKNIIDGSTGEFFNSQGEGWVELTREELESYNLGKLKQQKITNELESNYTSAQFINVVNGHTFQVSLKGQPFLDVERQVISASLLGSADLIAKDINGDIQIISNIPYSVWLQFYTTAKQISVNNLALKNQVIADINATQTLQELELINLNPFPAIQTISLEL